MIGKMTIIDAKTAKDFLLPRHYSGRNPQISKAFGWFDNGELKAVCTFGKPASHHLCKGICGDEFASHVYELNRLCKVEGWEYPLSMFVSWCLRQLKTNNWIVVSYADTGMNHCGYIYQACNFIYTGKTKKRTDRFIEIGKHSRHTENYSTEYRVVRTAKHRYIYFCTNNRKLKQTWESALNYPIEPYPKEENKHYILGEYQQPTLVKIKQ